ncbi:Rpn family recombination-promoting nuclease/putative transposase [Xylocopilactobacillus apicola]|uniref:Transposase/invertase (TIGR01784 family) n=1 Tax=Xylocopilactobacillus apicola TaxID=2932184 RepID=A0AAU9CYM2_9LACO|nr:Rpn family recombination-promoting nuclease/putative transposase [Xylocopilactobacillus apicola]BDR59107.1 hypothetical protein XA3_15480 [Xylocopilactobacillus apicola]
MRPDPDFFERSYSYLAHAYLAGYSNQAQMVSKNRPFSSMGETYSLNVLGFNLFPDEDGFRHYPPPYDSVHDDYGYGDSTFVELKKRKFLVPGRKRQVNVNDWVAMIEQDEIHSGAIDYIKDSYEFVRYQNIEKEELEMMDAIEMARHEMRLKEKVALEEGEARGEARGKAEGRAKAIRETAKRMLANQMSVQDIHKFTELSYEEIEKLK